MTTLMTDVSGDIDKDVVTFMDKNNNVIAVCIDTNDDGKIDVVLANQDVTGDGKIDAVDEKVMREKAEAMLNKESEIKIYLKKAIDMEEGGQPIDAVTFMDEKGETLASCMDCDDDGKVDWILIKQDLTGDGIINKEDKDRIKKIANEFLELVRKDGLDATIEKYGTLNLKL